MIPSTAIFDTSLKEVDIPSNTYKILTTNNTVSGYTDGLEAVKQSVYLILNTERYAYIIYSWNYGVEFVDLIGQPMNYVMAEIKKRITDALLQDNRISSVDNFQFKTSGKKLHVTFVVTCDYGTLEATREVQI